MVRASWIFHLEYFFFLTDLNYRLGDFFFFCKCLIVIFKICNLMDSGLTYFLLIVQ